MLSRSIFTKAWAFSASKSVTALTTACQTRLYASGNESSGDSTSNKTIKTENVKADSRDEKKITERPSLSSLIANLTSQRTTSSSSTYRVPKLSSLLNDGSAPLKADNSVFTGYGRFGRNIDTPSFIEEDPMSSLILHVHASSNNTILSLTDANGRVIVNASGGTVGFRKAQRAGFEAAYQATASVVKTIREKNINVQRIEIKLKGFGAGREAAFKAINNLTNWAVFRITDTTPIPFNGCRPKKARRL
ncbi:hypothetical protein GGI25_000051 [Coemansia spiralis]|uniref:Ribosomal protein S11 n=2 Tax=Coemansia TaxID=4863 RepID=A0A9W8GCI3_9FUNG|nr:hypothetical protein EDC05_002696 [Coemansia umbellata]KAJ2623071.1 hypothetical protein GGI26_002680 [Coemansia sp. RSA 1358]KAJ2681096.1 hypothetical protein GGI25_000051 [Coemansia spiralis]